MGPDELLGSVQKFAYREENPAVNARGNCGISAYFDWKVHFHGAPELIADCSVLTRDSGVNALSGCCGTSPEHVEVMVHVLNRHPPERQATLAEIEAKLGNA